MKWMSPYGQLLRHERPKKTNARTKDACNGVAVLPLYLYVCVCVCICPSKTTITRRKDKKKTYAWRALQFTPQTSGGLVWSEMKASPLLRRGVCVCVCVCVFVSNIHTHTQPAFALNNSKRTVDACRTTGRNARESEKRNEMCINSTHTHTNACNTETREGFKGGRRPAPKDESSPAPRPPSPPRWCAKCRRKCS